MSEISEQDLNRLMRLWAEETTIHQEIGKILLKQPQIKERISQLLGTNSAQVLPEKLGMKKLELGAVIRRKDGSIRKTQDYGFEIGGNGEGKLKNRVIKNFPEGG